jgi:hypothetical protein
MAKSRGRPQWQQSPKDRRFVEAMAAGGIDQDRIAAALGVAPKTLRRHCRDVLDSGADRANAKVIAAMLHMATKAPYAVRYQAARFWLQCRAGWREPEKALLTSIKSFMDMSAEEFDQMLIINGEQPVNLPPVPGYGNERVVPFQRPRR